MSLLQFSLRQGSGGTGRWRGGDGVVRDIQFLRPLTAGILSERRALRPFGMAGGGDGQRGQNLWIVHGGGDVESAVQGRVVSLGGKATVQMGRLDRLLLLTPGGGGYGSLGAQEEQGGAPTGELLPCDVAAPRGSVAAFRAAQETA